jgi:hypothetical protein
MSAPRRPRAVQMKQGFKESPRERRSRLGYAFAALRAAALVVGPYLFFNSRLEQIGALSLRHAVPTICLGRQVACFMI